MRLLQHLHQVGRLTKNGLAVPVVETRYGYSKLQLNLLGM